MNIQEILPKQSDPIKGLFYSYDSHAPREHDLLDHRFGSGSSKLVGIPGKIIGRSNGLIVSEYQTIFSPEFVLDMPDEGFIHEIDLKAKSITFCPRKLWHEASVYDRWTYTQGKMPMPEFGAAVEAFCKKRVSLRIGIGGYILFESRADAASLVTYYSAMNS